MRQVLFISDDLPLVQLVADGLRRHGLSVSRESPTRCVTAVPRASAVAVLLDVLGQPVPISQLVLDIRRQGPLPLIVFMGDGDRRSVAEYLDAGADDCIVRPADRDDVVARIRAVLRRSEWAGARRRQAIDVGGLRVDPPTRTVFLNDDPVGCTPAEYDVLECLARSAGHAISRDELSAAACGRPASPFDRSIDVHISHLRRKLRHHGRQIVTVRGVGYMLVDGSGATTAGSRRNAGGASGR